VQQLELSAWAAKPDNFACYVVDNNATTWLGAPLGRVIKSNTYRNNFGAKIRSVQIRGTNGARYFGRFGSDWSQLVRLTKMKEA
jgi:hypothetical protein